MENEGQIAHEQQAYSEDGVDLTLIRWMLSLAPAERLQALQQYVDSLLTIRAWNSENRLSRTPASLEAIAEGRKLARGVDRYLMGETKLP